MNAQEVSSKPSEPRTQRPSDVRDAIGKRASKAERRAAFAVALRNGCSIAECSRIAGVARNTGTQWARQFRQQKGLDRERDAIVQKQRLAEIYSEMIEDSELSGAYRIDAGSNLSKLMGYDAPQRSQIEVRAIPASVNSWLEQLGTVDAEARIIESGDCAPPKALADKASA